MTAQKISIHCLKKLLEIKQGILELRQKEGLKREHRRMRGGKKSEKDERDEVKQTNTIHRNYELS